MSRYSYPPRHSLLRCWRISLNRNTKVLDFVQLAELGDSE